MTTTRDEPILEPAQEPVELTPTESRQATNNKWTVSVLVLSTAAAAIAMGLFMFHPG